MTISPPRTRTTCLLAALLGIAAAALSFAQPNAPSRPPTLAQPAPVEDAGNADLAILLKGVREIASPGVPGPVAVWGPNAFAVATGQYSNTRAPVVAAARVGGQTDPAINQGGRVVIFGHSAYLDAKTAAAGDTGTLLSNAARWVSPRNASAQTKTRVGVVGGGGGGGGEGDLGSVLGAGFEIVRLGRADWTQTSVDILVFPGGDLSADQVEALQAHLRSGKGALIAATGWGWCQLNGGKPIVLSGFSKALAPFGLGWTERTLETDTRERYLTRSAPAPLLHAVVAFDALNDHDLGKRPLAPAEVDQAVASVELAAQILPKADTALRPRLDQRLKTLEGELVPTRKNPLTNKQPLRRVLLTHQIASIMQSPRQARTAHPAAAEFPGLAPVDAPRVARAVDINTAIPDWQSTGTYASAGETITIAIPETALDAGLKVRIGCHTDALWHKDHWDRCPDVSWDFKITAAQTEIATPFGGLVYIEVPKGCKAGVVAARISNIVDAPLFVAGKTSLEDWRARIRNFPAPWAEIASGKIIVTVPSSHVRTLDDPEALMRIWDEVADAAADLAARPRERARPERYVADVQISAGYMHSGYPIMTHLDAADDMVSAAALRKGTWGLYHELGHNHQNADWTFGGTGEVTVNLFSMYIIEKVCNVRHGQTHEAFKNRERSIGVHLAQGAPFEKWKSDPFLALYMYCQLEEAFGWDAFKTVFTEYRDLPKDERPKTDEQKRDQWMVRFSRTVGKNLGPFFQAWGVPTSERARASIKDLPVWMPPEFPPN